jgi:hypothetical protein
MVHPATTGHDQGQQAVRLLTAPWHRDTCHITLSPVPTKQLLS